MHEREDFNNCGINFWYYKIYCQEGVTIKKFTKLNSAGEDLWSNIDVEVRKKKNMLPKDIDIIKNSNDETATKIILYVHLVQQDGKNNICFPFYKEVIFELFPENNKKDFQDGAATVLS